MQTDPALPWAAGTGGRILLRQPVTRQDLLDGLVQIVVAYERYGMHILSVVDYRGDLKFTDTSGDFYFDVAAFTGETSELELTAVDPNSEVISVMQFDEAPTGIISYPQLRWDNTVTEAIIKLPFGATEGELRAGLLRFGFMGQSYAPIYGDNAFQVKINASDAFTFPFNSSTIKEIQLTRNGSAFVETVELQTSDVYTNAPLPSSESPLYIGLKDSINSAALLAGALVFNIKDNPADTAGGAEVYDNSGTLVIGKSQNAYSIQNIVGNTKSLTVTKILENPSVESIESLETYFSPQLPWSERGTYKIGIKDGITVDEIAQGKLKVLTSEGEAVLSASQSLNFVLGSYTVLSIDRYEGSSKLITATRNDISAAAVTQILVS